MDWRRLGRRLFLACSAAIISGIVMLLARHLLLPLLVWIAPGTEAALFDLGAYGPFRAKTYHSFQLASPWISTPKWDDSCDNGLVFFDLSGPSAPNKGPMILQSTGELVWTSDVFGVTLNSAVQTYRGENFLTFWTGKKAKTSGQGVYHMLDSQYRLIHTVAAVGHDLRGDLHEFKITKDDTALFTVYNVTQTDLSDMDGLRGRHGWIVDGVFQEVDIASGELLFEWRASDHFDPSDSFMWHPLAGYTSHIPFDFFHINSIDKDSHGNYLISSRHLHILVYVDGRNGEPIWILGGQFNDLQDLSDGQASDFSWQHDARWVSEEDGIISLFDNGRAWPHIDSLTSQGRMIQVDASNRTVTLLHTYASFRQTGSSSQGSLQVINPLHSDPHVYIGWGSSAVLTEHSLNGDLLCEQHYGASAFHFWERIKSYRAFKAPVSAWSGQPADWNPSVGITGDQLWASWNGATTVAFYELQGSHIDASSNDDDFHTIDIIAKGRDFETDFSITDYDYACYRVAALDSERNVLRYSNTARRTRVDTTQFALGLVLSCASLTLITMGWIAWRRKRHSAREHRASPNTLDQYKYQKLW